MDTTDQSRYAKRGVSSGKEEVEAAVAQEDKGLFPGAFCKIFPFDDKRHLVAHADGTGTKAGLAYLAHKHGHNISVWEGIAQDGIVMNTDDVACVGAVRNYRLTSAINRNTFRIPGEVISAIIAGGSKFCREMTRWGVPTQILSGETADVPDLVRTITLDYALTEYPEHDEIIDASNIRCGDVIIGFSSTGQAAWEAAPNSGIGSNGLTNARHDCLHPDYRADTETYSPEMPQEQVYCGKFHLEDPLPGDSSFTIASALLSPTRTYVPLIAKILARTRERNQKVHAFIHCSGGGQTKIGKFGPPDLEYHKDNLFPLPPLFEMLQSVRHLPWDQVYKSYNAGHRLEAVVPETLADVCFEIADECGINAQRVGYVKKRVGNDRVIIHSDFGLFLY